MHPVSVPELRPPSNANGEAVRIANRVSARGWRGRSGRVRFGAMSALDRFLPEPRLRQIDSVDVGVPAAEAFQAISHVDLGELPIARALFTLRTLPDRARGRESEPPALRISDFAGATHGFRLLAQEPDRGFVVGAIGKVWESVIPFVDVAPAAYAAYAEPGQVKVAWELRVDPLTPYSARVTIEVRVTATDDESWARFRRYFWLIGPFSHLIRRMLLAQLGHRLGRPDVAEAHVALPGDELVPHAKAMHTDAISIDAPPGAVWPWLVQMGGDRAGWYSYDVLDNAGRPSAREIDPALGTPAVGDLFRAVPGAADGFTVAAVEPERALVLWGALDVDADRPLALGAEMPEHYWRVSWAFVLEPEGEGGTRLLARVRGDWAPERLVWRARMGLLAHHFMEHEQLRNLKRRAEGTLPRDTSADVLEGLGGASRMLAALATPFLRRERSHWGLDAALAARSYPGDERVPEPRWSWTHGVEVDAPAAEVWPWVAQIGADRAGFYSYQFLENLAKCDVANADRVHAEWQRTAAQSAPMVLHPAMPPMPIVAIEPGRYFLAHAERREGDPHEASVSWLFLVEPLGEHRARVVSRFRSAYSDRLATRLAMGPAVTEPIGFAMDRRMLLGIKERAERDRRG